MSELGDVDGDGGVDLAVGAGDGGETGLSGNPLGGGRQLFDYNTLKELDNALGAVAAQ